MTRSSEGRSYWSKDGQSDSKMCGARLLLIQGVPQMGRKLGSRWPNTTLCPHGDAAAGSPQQGPACSLLGRSSRKSRRMG